MVEKLARKTTMNKQQYNLFLNESIENIKNALDNRNLTIFAGSGVSVDSNLPLWSELIDDIKKALGTQERDFLKIAELFYIQFKENTYYEKINQYFPKNSLPNILHKQITKLNLRNLITTNWDDLFEKAIHENGVFFDIIRSDNEIGYSTGMTKLVKMHGSLDMKNIVFKESDYFTYSLSFPLVENYVKSVFSTDTVLLVGYSLGDINVKQIVSWVNFQSKSIKPVYFLKIDSEFDYLEFEYYKSKNIFVLYWNDDVVNNSECCNDIKTLSRKTQITFNFIERISVDNININNLSYKNIIEDIYNALRVTDGYDYVMPQTVIDIIRHKFNLYGINELFYENNTIVIQNKKLCHLLMLLRRAKNKKILDYLNKTMHTIGANSIRCMNDNKNIYTCPAEDRHFNNYLYDFDFQGLRQELQKISICGNASSNDKTNLRKAFLLYQNRNFRESYELLKDVATNSFKNGKFDIWFIAEFNKKYFCNLMRGEQQYLQDEVYAKEIECYCREIGKIDIQAIINKLPLKYREILKPLYDFTTFLDQKLLSSIYTVNSLNKDLNIWKKGGFSYNNNISKSIQTLFDVELFIQSYSLTLEYDYKIRAIYENVFKSSFIYKQISKQNEIDTFLFSIGIRSFTGYKDLNDFVKTYSSQEFEMCFSDEQAVLSLINNLVQKIKEERSVSCFYCQYLHNLMVLISYIKISRKTFEFLIEKFNDLLLNNFLSITEYEVMNIFIVNQYDENKQNLDMSKLETIIKEYIELFINSKFNIYDIEATRHTSLFKNIFTILKNIEDKYEFNEQELISRFINRIKDFHVDSQGLIARLFLTRVWFVGSIEVKKSIEEYLELLLNRDTISDYDKLELMYLMVSNDIGLSKSENLAESITKYKDKYSGQLTTEAVMIQSLIEEIETKFKTQNE